MNPVNGHYVPCVLSVSNKEGLIFIKAASLVGKWAVVFVVAVEYGQMLCCFLYNVTKYSFS
jgi:hypothetical protein